MKDEEIAEEYANGKGHEHYNYLFEENAGSPADFAKLCFKDGYNKANEEREEQIEKMKCCGNCTHRHYWGNELGCNLGYDKEDECNHNNKKYWEFKEG